jgi:AIG1 family
MIKVGALLFFFYICMFIHESLFFRFLLNKTIDVLLFVERLDAYRVDSLDKQVVKSITETFGKAIWSRSVLVLTHAQLSPPDGLSYEDFCSRRSEAVLRYMRAGAGISWKVFEVYEQDSQI